LVLLY
jgi:hypothetical protein